MSKGPTLGASFLPGRFALLKAAEGPSNGLPRPAALLFLFFYCFFFCISFLAPGRAPEEAPKCWQKGLLEHAINGGGIA